MKLPSRVELSPCVWYVSSTEIEIKPMRRFIPMKSSGLVHGNSKNVFKCCANQNRRRSISKPASKIAIGTVVLIDDDNISFDAPCFWFDFVA
jgi:hypothetical protein